MANFDRYGPRRRVSGGIEARSKRGSFGTTWWGKHFVSTMEELADAGRLSRGRTYARGGQVLSLEIGRGQIRGDVQGSQIDPFSAVVTVAPLTEEQAAALVEEVGATPGMLAELASGSVPRALETRLLPSSASELDFACSCPDMGWPCKHAAALTYLVAEEIDRDATKILHLRGVDLDRLIDGVEEAPPTVDPRDHFGDRVDFPALPSPPRLAATEDLDASWLRKALRTADVDEAEVSGGVHDLDALYRRMVE